MDFSLFCLIPIQGKIVGHYNIFRSFKITRLKSSGLFKGLIIPAWIFITLLLIGTQSFAELCGEWGEAIKTGELDPSQINEASGIAVSSKYPGRLYHVNDSGGGPYFYITNIKGGDTKRVKLEGLKYSRRSDYEDLGLGPCGLDKTCLFIADIGDNRENRKYIEFILIEEKENYEDKVTPLRVLKLKYPDRAHNAEGLAVHPNGDVYILSKEEDLDKLEAYPSKLYKLDQKKLHSSGEEPLTLEYIGEIDLPKLLTESTVFGQIATSLDISPDGSLFLVLTYENAVEFNIDLSKTGVKDITDMKKGEDFNIIDLNPLPQQESAAYMPDGSGIIYNTELKGFSVPLVRVNCED